MAARRNIVPTAEISIAATVVDPSSLLFALFFPCLFFSFLSLFLTHYQEQSASDEKRRLLTASSESANWARLINQVTSQWRPIDFGDFRWVSNFSSHDTTNKNLREFCMYNNSAFIKLYSTFIKRDILIFAIKFLFYYFNFHTVR